MPVGMALLSVAFPPSERAKALGQFAGITGLAIIAGPALGGIIAQGLSWHWIFWLNVPLGLVLLPLIGRHIAESRGTPVPLDLTGLALMIGAAFGLVWGLIRANEAGWTSAEVSGTLALGAILVLAFVLWERHAAHPMVPMRLFQAPAFSGGTAAAFLYSAAMYGILFFIAQFLAVVQGHGPMSAGLHLLPWTATLFFVAPLAGRLVNKVGERPLVVIGSTAQAVGLAWISLIASPDVPYLALLGPLILAGIGVSMAMPSAQNAVIGAVQPQEIGTASGIFSTVRFLGGTFGIAIAVTAFAANGDTVSAQSFAHGFSVAIGVSAALSLLAAIAGMWIPSRQRQTTGAAPQRA
jgi:EmrB/QacA subfamily drug resistance transporter